MAVLPWTRPPCWTACAPRTAPQPLCSLQLQHQTAIRGPGSFRHFAREASAGIIWRLSLGNLWSESLVRVDHPRRWSGMLTVCRGAHPTCKCLQADMCAEFKVQYMVEWRNSRKFNTITDAQAILTKGYAASMLTPRNVVKVLIDRLKHILVF